MARLLHARKQARVRTQKATRSATAALPAHVGRNTLACKPVPLASITDDGTEYSCRLGGIEIQLWGRDGSVIQLSSCCYTHTI